MVAASHLRGRDNFDLVSRGFASYRRKEYAEAVAAYRKALEVNPHDVATMCRLGAALQKQGEMAQALEWFRSAATRHVEIGDEVMVSWCFLGLAQTELAAGNLAAAHTAAERVLGLSDPSGRHAQAREILGRAAGQ